MRTALGSCLFSLFLAFVFSCGGLEIPEPLKSELPEYPGANLRAVSTDSRGGAGVSFDTEDTPDAVFEFYGAAAGQRSWKLISEYRPDANTLRRRYRKGPYVLTVHAGKSVEGEPTSVHVGIRID